MLELKISNKNESTYYPDLQDNLKEPENERFGIVIAKKHRMIVQSQSVGTDGKFDFCRYTKACVVRIENPPMLVIGKLKRALTVDDIFEMPELDSIATELFSRVTQMQNGETDLKN